MVEILKRFIVSTNPYGDFTVRATNAKKAIESVLIRLYENEDVYPEELSGIPVVKEISGTEIRKLM